MLGTLVATSAERIQKEVDMVEDLLKSCYVQKGSRFCKLAEKKLLKKSKKEQEWKKIEIEDEDHRR